MLTEILSTPTAQLGRASRFVVFQIKLWSHCARLLRKNRSGQQAAALSYHTIFGIIPLAIVMLLVFQLFPSYSDIGVKVKDFVYKQIHLSIIRYNPQEAEKPVMSTEFLDNITADFFKGVNKGSITLVSVILVIWAALALLSTIEEAFNNIWHVGKGRNFLHRIINYWALLTLGPLLLGAGIYIATQYSAIGEIQKNITPELFSFLIAAVTFFLLYFLLPNTKVQAKAAAWGSVVAALVWMLAKWGFGVYVTRFIPYNEVYGALGLIPLTVFWIFISWLIVLFGLQLTFTTQHLKSLDAAEIASAKKTDEYFIANDLTAINIVREIADAFEKNNSPLSSEVICSKLNVPADFGEKILNHLIDRGLIMKTSDPKVGFVPAKEPENIRLSEIADAVAAAGFAQSAAHQPGSLEQIAQSQRNVLAQYNIRQILST